MTTVASGCCTSAPALVDNAIGRKPRPATSGAMIMARIFSIDPRTVAS